VVELIDRRDSGLAVFEGVRGIQKPRAERDNEEQQPPTASNKFSCHFARFA
jgi:hypothetical protein